MLPKWISHYAHPSLSSVYFYYSFLLYTLHIIKYIPITKNLCFCFAYINIQLLFLKSVPCLLWIALPHPNGEQIQHYWQSRQFRWMLTFQLSLDFCIMCLLMWKPLIKPLRHLSIFVSYDCEMFIKCDLGSMTVVSKGGVCGTEAESIWTCLLLSL